MIFKLSKENNGQAIFQEALDSYPPEMNYPISTHPSHSVS